MIYSSQETKRLRFAFKYYGPELHENLLESIGVKTCESFVDGHGETFVFMNTIKPMRDYQVEKAINSWNNDQSSSSMRIVIGSLLGEKNIVTFGQVIGTRASDHCIVEGINRARDDKNPSYRFWSSKDSFASNAQISSKKQKTAHSARQTTMEEVLVDKRVAPGQEEALVDERPIVCATFVSVAPESVMVDVPATLLSVEVAPGAMVDERPTSAEVAPPMADQQSAIPPVAPPMADQSAPQAIAQPTADPAEQQPDAMPSEEDIIADVEAISAESVPADSRMTIANFMILATGIMVDIKKEIIVARREMLRFKLTNLTNSIANKDELLASKDAVIASKDAVIATQTASHEAAMTARQASIDALTASNAAKDKQIERLRAALAALQ